MSAPGSEAVVGTEEDPSGPAHVKLVRVIDRTTHVSSRARTRELEFHVRNDTENEYIVLHLPLPEFVTNLKIFDEDGRRLSYYPNAEVKELLAELAKEDPEAFERFQRRFKHARYKLLIMFPVDHPLKPGSMRTIRLEFENTDPVSFKTWSLFSKPTFSATDTRLPGHGHEHFFIVVSTPDFAVEWSTRVVKGTADASKLYENGENGRTRVLSVRLPPASEGLYAWKVDYLLAPARRTTAFLLALFFYAGVVLGAALLAAPLVVGGLGWEFTAAAKQVGLAVSGGLAATALAVAFSLEEHWAERYKLWLALPFALNATGWFAWWFL